MYTFKPSVEAKEMNRHKWSHALLPNFMLWFKSDVWTDIYTPRYLMDVDGNGWSGRFHRLMGTRSAVLKRYKSHPCIQTTKAYWHSVTHKHLNHISKSWFLWQHHFPGMVWKHSQMIFPLVHTDLRLDLTRVFFASRYADRIQPWYQWVDFITYISGLIYLFLSHLPLFSAIYLSGWTIRTYTTCKLHLQSTQACMISPRTSSSSINRYPCTSSMAFFTGDLNGKGAQDEAGKMIGEAGSQWAQEFWRIEDMQAYMYRLILVSVSTSGLSVGSGEADFVWLMCASGIFPVNKPSWDRWWRDGF